MGAMKTCPACKGHKHETTVDITEDGYMRMGLTNCGTCNGTGEVPDPSADDDD